MLFQKTNTSNHIFNLWVNRIISYVYFLLKKAGMFLASTTNNTSKILDYAAYKIWGSFSDITWFCYVTAGEVLVMSFLKNRLNFYRLWCFQGKEGCFSIFLKLSNSHPCTFRSYRKNTITGKAGFNGEI